MGRKRRNKPGRYGRRCEGSQSSFAIYRAVGAGGNREVDSLRQHAPKEPHFPAPYQEAVDEFKKAFLSVVLRANNGNQSKSAKQLGVHRNTLTRTILAMHIDLRAMRPSARRRPPQAELQVLPHKKERLP